jgi:ribosomal protein S18 acetylase RimI-like enzyme
VVSDYIIRKARITDLEACREICIATAEGRNLSTSKKRAALCNRFCDPYIEKFTDNCYVAESRTEGVFGYILCAPDIDEYASVVKKHYAKALYKLSFGEAVQRRFEIPLSKSYKKEAAAHLHIDILPIGQKQGVGGKLVRTLLESLEKNRINGVALGVGTANKNAVSFYKHIGFTILKSLPGAYIMIKRTSQIL